ncbi:hypothetical protein [Chryseobacterium arthrosphaerae]|uniref:hypothetical protein n=1 Tax=Chryseobacterium arthrosphaerae TaxID=651561 RepID=UPI0024153A37|nr:hypothetical protein [Chryseobacterium arthrosphaerae]MDG4655260.1 hypothetical protein [Chryseobacterium arthrosphaerae]
MFGNLRIADFIAINCFRIDCKCREDFRESIIISERDYVSNLTSEIRNYFRSHRMRSHSQSIAGGYEQKFGVDGIFIFRHENSIKVGIFEAKRPLLNLPDHPWDYLSTRGISHFSEQISKQNIWSNQFAIWEMFFNETSNDAFSPPFEYFGSTCFWHINALNYMNSKTLMLVPWKTSNISDLASTSSQNFYTIIFDIVSCKQGKIYSIKEGDINLTIINEKDESIKLDIPLPTLGNQEFDEKINRFLIENEFDNYLYLDFSEINR